MNFIWINYEVKPQFLWYVEVLAHSFALASVSKYVKYVDESCDFYRVKSFRHNRIVNYFLMRK